MMKFWIVILFLSFSFIINAQEVNFNGNTYTVKGESILNDGADVTNTLTKKEQEQIMLAFNKKKELDKASKKKQKRLKKAEKGQKTAKKRQNKAEKALKRKQKAQSNFDKSVKKHRQAIEKYQKLKKKGKLSPEDEAKWLKKIEKYKKAHIKAENRLKRV
ncbi:hypothetical protein [Jejuia spongiicola]|uniref:Uncharacterized protein n=1 Tax=Jejuia spongiicola TaxID=2942207 RepID=A0ABT0QCX5_9FLAO|nr:hypothetical protein [Jejuia spongiicola]MCL6293830.1 hypothetical protein [Jejuia spongiicola]